GHRERHRDRRPETRCRAATRTPQRRSRRDPPGQLHRRNRRARRQHSHRRLLRQSQELNNMYTYKISAADMFTDRADQFEKFGIPPADIQRVRAATTDMWADAPGGWVYEWSKLAEQYADRGDRYLASMV